MGDVLGDLNFTARPKIIGMETQIRNRSLYRGTVPLWLKCSAMQPTYASITQGRASIYDAVFSHAMKRFHRVRWPMRNSCHGTRSCRAVSQGDIR